jgi:hypothetical protein
MLYKFKSPAAADLIMLEPNGRQILTIIGRGDSDSLINGILLPQDMPSAIKSLEVAMTQDDAERLRTSEEARSAGEEVQHLQGVSLRHRAVPFVDMVQRCLRSQESIVWGV